MSDFTKFSDGTNTYNVKDANALPISGGAMTGDITTSVTTFTDTSLVTKDYVDTIVGDINTILEEVL